VTDRRVTVGAGCALLAVVSCAGLLETLVHAAPQDGSRPEVARWLAGDAIAYFELARPDVLIDRIKDPRIQDFLTVAPGYRRFVEGPSYAQLRAVIDLVANRLGTTWEAGLRDLTAGGIVAAVEADGAPEPRIYLVITPRDAGLLERASRVLLELARKDAADKGKADPVSTSQHSGVTVHTLEGGKGGAFAVAGGRLVISNAVGSLNRLLDRGLAERAAGPTGGGGAKGASLYDDPEWKRRRALVQPDDVAWGIVRLDRLRQIDPKRYALKEKGDTGIVLLFGSWYEAIKGAPWIGASARWTDSVVGLTVELPVPKGGRPAPVAGYVPGQEQGSAPLLQPGGTLASLSLWRDWATLWESRAELLAPEVVQGLANLDTFAGQFFGGRDFGNDVLGAFDPHWRLVIAQQDYAQLKPAPAVKLPGFALVAEVNAADSEFVGRLKVAFQSIVAISNVEAAQKKAPVFELGSEQVEGITIATTRYLPSGTAAAAGEPGSQRYNFSPASAQVGKFFVLSTSTHLARALVKELKARQSAPDAHSRKGATLTVEADGPEVARLLEQNRGRMVMQAMLKQGETKENAERQVARLLGLARYLGHGRLDIRDDLASTRMQLTLQLSK
jgi:hypothetical protein